MPKKGYLGCSFPLMVVILVVFLALFIVGFIAGPLGSSLFPGLELPGWLTVARPHPELAPERVFFNTPITNSVIGAWLTIIVLVGFSYAVSRRLKIIPARLQSLLEFALGSLLGFCQSVAGEKNGRRFFPVVATIFLFVAFNAWLSLLPGFGSILVPGFKFVDGAWVRDMVPLFRGANTDINMPLALALMSFVFVEYFGLRSLGIRYLRKFFNFRGFIGSVRQIFTGKLKSGLLNLITGVLNIFTGLLEGLSELIRVVSLTFRLFGNMTAGEILLLVAAFLIPWVFAVPFYGLELLIGFIQALIFGGLTLIFLTLAVESHDEEVH